MLMTAHTPLPDLEHADEFVPRHIGPTPDDEAHMLSVIGAASRRALIEAVVPKAIARMQGLADHTSMSRCNWAMLSTLKPR